MLTFGLKGDFDRGKQVLRETAKAIELILTKRNLTQISKLAKELKVSKDMYLIGRGFNYPTASEAALKIKEVSYIHAEGFAGGDLKHGPIALIEKDTPTFVFAASDDSEQEILSNAMEIAARGGRIIGIGPKNNKVFNDFIEVPDLPQTSALLNIVPAQVLAYYLALELHCDPDKPRNLAKSVTVK
jgi:glucosamine--fructose-6-phosphate aminotransferase (isomerizing)